MVRVWWYCEICVRKCRIVLLEIEGRRGAWGSVDGSRPA